MTSRAGVEVRSADASDRAGVEQLLRESWGSTTVVSRGYARDASRLPAVLALEGDEIVGLATFELSGADCELVTLDALRVRQGIGTALLAAVREQAAGRGCRRLWLITTNDNLAAVRFYQRRGLRLVAVHRGVVDEARRIKPAIPLLGDHGIRIRDEWEFELLLR